MHTLPGGARSFFAGAILALAAILAPTAATARNAQAAPISQPESQPPTIADLETRLEAIRETQDIDDSVRNLIADNLTAAIVFLRQRDEAIARKADLDHRATEAPAQAEAIRAELASPPPEPDPAVGPDATLAQASAALLQAQADLAAAQKAREDLRAEGVRRTEELARIPERIAQLRQRILALTPERTAATPDGEDPAITRSRHDKIEAEFLALNAQIAAYESETASYRAREQLLQLRIDRAERQVASQRRAVERVQEIETAKRRSEAEAAQREAARRMREVAGLAEPLRELAALNERLAAARTGPEGTARQLEQIQSDLRNVRSQLESLQNRADTVVRKVAVAAGTDHAALALRSELANIPNIRQLGRVSREYQTRLSNLEYFNLELEDLRRNTIDVDSWISDVVASVGRTAPDIDANAIETLARESLATQLRLIADVQSDIDNFRDRSLDLVATIRDLIETSTAFQSFIEERIFWVRSVPRNRALNFAAAPDAVRWLILSPDWSAEADRAWRTAKASPWALAIFLILLVGAYPFIRWSTIRLAHIAERASRFETDTFRLTAHAIALTLASAALFPLLVYLIAELMTDERVADPHILAWSAGLKRVAFFLLLFQVLRHTIRANGLAAVHFRWRPRTLTFIRRHIRWAMPIGLAFAFIVTAMEHQPVAAWDDALGRACFILGMIALTIFVALVFHPTKPGLSGIVSAVPDGWLSRTRFIIYPLAIALPLTLGVIALIGYYYTALVLQRRLQETILAILLCLLLNATLLRWLYIARRRLAVRAARERAEAAAALRKDDEANENQPVLDARQVDIPALDLQTRRLISLAVGAVALIALYTIWAGTLPALRMLDRIELYPSIRVVDAISDRIDPPAVPPQPATEPTDAEPAPISAQPSTMRTPIPGAISPAASPKQASRQHDGTVSLGDLGLAILILIVTVIGARDIPGLLEFTFLQRLPLDAGSRFAIVTIVRYIIAIGGSVIIFGVLGIDWSKVQWLAAALTFGLAFGLQEIFANFVSGLIILAERPIRVGDVVTVGDTSGTVTRIRMRATTIADWDRKELIVPNKSFITDRVINWTLSDSVLRMRVEVGVAYGSDIAKVEQSLLKVAQEAPHVLSTPGPGAFFLGFGDSTLNFELRVFIPHIEHLVTTRHYLHCAIDRHFRAEGIEIAFPQRDLHIRSIGPLAEIVRPDGAAIPIPPAKNE